MKKVILGGVLAFSLSILPQNAEASFWSDFFSSFYRPAPVKESTQIKTQDQTSQFTNESLPIKSSDSVLNEKVGPQIPVRDPLIKEAILRRINSNTSSRSVSNKTSTPIPNSNKTPVAPAANTPTAPTLSSISPSSGYIGQNITLYGSFTASNNRIYVSVNGKNQAIAPTFQNISLLQFTIPVWLQNQGVVNLFVENGDFIMSKTSLPLTIVATPSAPAYTPPLHVDLTADGQDNLTVARGSTVILRWNSTSATSCNTDWGAPQGVNGSVYATINEDKVFKVSCMSGSNTITDSVQVKVQVAQNTSAPIPVSTTPVITSISPSSASVGQTITIYGNNFTATENVVYIKTQNTTTTIRPSYQGVDYVKFTLPVYAKGSVSFAVENGRIEISPYVNFSVTETSSAPVSQSPRSTSLTASVFYKAGDIIDKVFGN